MFAVKKDPGKGTENLITLHKGRLEKRGITGDLYSLDVDTATRDAIVNVLGEPIVPRCRLGSTVKVLGKSIDVGKIDYVELEGRWVVKYADDKGFEFFEFQITPG